MKKFYDIISGHIDMFENVKSKVMVTENWETNPVLIDVIAESDKRIASIKDFLAKHSDIV